MDFIHWIGGHGFDLFEAFGIIASLLLVCFTIHRDERARRLSNLLAITEARRAIWSEFDLRPELKRVLAPNANVDQTPVSETERLFVASLILHLSVSFRAIQDGMRISTEGLQRDIRAFFCLPVPRAIWNEMRPNLDDDFVEFVEAALVEGK